MHRQTTKKISIGNVSIGGGQPILIQSMTNTKTEDVNSTVEQILKLEEAGCDIIRVSVPTEKSARAIRYIKEKVHIPLVADIHFDYRLAILAVENGADKIRINPGNIGNDEKLLAVVNKCKERGIPIRVGVNSGSLEKDVLAKYQKPCAEALAESALLNVNRIEKMDYDNLVISIKSSDVYETVNAYKIIAEKTYYPLHLGITEAGTIFSGTIKSAVGLSLMLADGIGDTLRVSLTGDPVQEIKVAQNILQALHLYSNKVEIISCPTCGRTEIGLIELANTIEKRCEGIKKPIKVAIMGCVVNGPGEAKEADIGVAGGRGVGVIFKKGEVIKKVSESELVDALMEEIHKL